MRVMVIGASGFIGAYFCEALLEAGHQVTGIDQRGTSNKFDLFLMDARKLRDFDIPCDIIFHCAGPAGPANIAPGYALQPIIDLTEAGLTYARKVGAKFVKMSSSECYGRSDSALSEEVAAFVPTRYDARSEYQIGFLAAECMCFTYPHLDVQVLRLFNVTGAGQRPETGCVLPRFCRQALRGEPLTVFGDGKQRRAFMHVSDLWYFCRALMENWPKEKGLWNVAAPQNEVSIEDLAGLIVARVGGGFIKNGKLCAGYRDSASKAHIDVAKARTIWFGALTPLDKIIDEMLEWERQHPGGA